MSAEVDLAVIGVDVMVAQMGDGKVAVIERETREPLQYATPASNLRSLVARWDEVFRAARVKANGGGR